MKFIDLNTQYQKLQADINERINKVFAHGQYIKGPEVTELEKRLADFIGVRHCISVANGSDALQIALLALDIKPGDEVITSDFTFVAPAEMAALLGAKVVLVDIDPKTYNMDANLLEQAISAKTKAIIPISLYGQCADFDAINNIAAKYNIPVIEDAAQSFGATYKNRYSGNLSTIACTSFFPSKPLGCYGDGGACFTNNDELAIKMTYIANHGQQGRYDHALLGLNSRLDSIQAAVLLAKLVVFAEELKQRIEIANQYNELLKNHVKIPYIEPHNTSAYAQYTIECDEREKVQKYLQENDIPTAVHYPRPVHQQPVFVTSCIKSGNLTNSSRAAQRVLSLPFSPYLTEQDLQKVANTLIRAMEL